MSTSRSRAPIRFSISSACCRRCANAFKAQSRRLTSFTRAAMACIFDCNSARRSSSSTMWRHPSNTSRSMSKLCSYFCAAIRSSGAKKLPMPDASVLNLLRNSSNVSSFSMLARRKIQCGCKIDGCAPCNGHVLPARVAPKATDHVEPHGERSAGLVTRLELAPHQATCFCPLILWTTSFPSSLEIVDIFRMSQLLIEIWENILSYSTYYELLRCRRVCRGMKSLADSFHFGENAPAWMIAVRANTDVTFRILYFPKIQPDPFNRTRELQAVDVPALQYKHNGRTCVLSIPPTVRPEGLTQRSMTLVIPFNFVRIKLYQHNFEHVVCDCGWVYEVDRQSPLAKCPRCRCKLCTNPRATWCITGRCARCCDHARCLGHVRRSNAAGVLGSRAKAEVRWNEELMT